MGFCAHRGTFQSIWLASLVGGGVAGGANLRGAVAYAAQAEASSPAQGRAPGPTKPSPFTNDLKDLTYIGFEALDDAVRVFVRTNEPVEYTLDSSHPQRLSLVLANCRIVAANNARPLDTGFFDGPVTSVVAHAVDEASPSVHVQIDLREAVHVHVAQHDTELSLQVVPVQ